jgi:hypothetical protein
VKHWDSDIEIISNPSQSSIEVLDEQTRLQSAVTPARLQFPEEKQMLSAAVPTQRPVAPEVSTHLISVTGLTESSSSGSLTDSICTTYEIYSESLSMRQGSMTAKLEETDNVITFSDGSKCADTNVSLGMDDGAEKLSRGSLDECDHEDESPLLLFRMHEERLSPQMNYASMLKDLLQSVGSKLPSKSSEKVLESALRNDRVKYSYTDFSVVDHRVKLYLYLHVFQHKQEELLFLLRAQIIPQSSSLSFPGCLVMSSRKVYVLQITGEEGDDPEQWLRTVESSPVEMLMLLFPLLWQQGVGMELLRRGEQPANFLFILQEQDHTINFFSFLLGVALPERCRVEHEMTQKQTMLVQQLLLSVAASDTTDPAICMCAVSYSCRIQRNEDKFEVEMGAIIVTTTDLLLMMDNLQWLFPKLATAPQTYCAQKIINLIEVELEDHYQLTLHFLDEAAGSDESWTLKLATPSAVKAIVSAIRIPWEQLFSVPLQVLNKNT